VVLVLEVAVPGEVVAVTVTAAVVLEVAVGVVFSTQTVLSQSYPGRH
jgi:hypothetical protein